MRGGIASFRARLRTLVKDYSIWDEAYEAVITDDRDWLYSNIGNAAAEIGTLDLIVFVAPARRRRPTAGAQGTRAGGQSRPAAGRRCSTRSDDCSSDAERDNGASGTLLAEFEGDALGVLDRARDAGGRRCRPGSLAGRPAAADPRAAALARAAGSDRPQPAGRRAGARRRRRPRGRRRSRCATTTGEVIRYVVWQPPRPGASILRQVALPLGLALLAHRRRQRRQLELCGALGAAARAGALRRQGGRPQQDRVPVERQPRAPDADERHPRRRAAPADHAARRRAAGARLGALRLGDRADGADLRPARLQPDGERQPPARRASRSSRPRSSRTSPR